MDFTLREWLIFVGIIVIVGVLLDGYRRGRAGSRGKLKMSINKHYKYSASDKVDYFNGELPNGGARVVTHSAEMTEDMHAGAEQEAPIPAFDVDPELRPDPLFANDFDPDSEPQLFDTPEPVAAIEELVAEASQELRAEPAMNAQPDVATPAPEKLQASLKPKPKSETTAPISNEPATTAESKPITEAKPASYQEVDEVIVINVFAKNEKGFNGDDLMRVILACGMRFGDMDIFHRSEENGGGAIQFSMANVVKPGTFDLADMENFFTPGVSFFLSLPGPKNTIKAFDYMHETAQCVVKNLDGELKDEIHSAMTSQTIEHARQKVRDYERRQLSLLR